MFFFRTVLDALQHVNIIICSEAVTPRWGEGLPVSGDVVLGDLEVEVGHASHGNAVASCAEVEEALLQLQRERQNHIPECSLGRK